MKKDPIVEEVRRIRHEYAARFGNDLDAIVEDARRLQAQEVRRIVTLPPKPVRVLKKAA